MHQLKSIYNSPFKDLHSHPIHACFPIIASNDAKYKNHEILPESICKTQVGFLCHGRGKNDLDPH